MRTPPFILNIDHTGSGGQCVNSIEQPIPTQTSKARTCLVSPFITRIKGTRKEQIASCSQRLDSPLPVITTKDYIGIVEPFMVTVNHGERKGQSKRVKSINTPLDTVTTKRGVALCEPFILGQHSCSAPRGMTDPIPTICTDGAAALVEPFITKYYGNEKDAHSVNEPLDTVTTKDRFALVQPSQKGHVSVDIRFRMLTNEELAAAQGFPKEYRFSGNKSEVTKQIGNAVPTETAAALASMII